MNKKVVFIVVWAIILPIFGFAWTSFWQSDIVYAEVSATTTPTVDPDAIAEKKDSISNLEDKLSKEKKEKAALEKELSKIQGSVSATQAEIGKVQKMIQDVENNISRKESEIAALEDKNILQKEVLKKIMQQLYYAKKDSGIGVVLASGDFAEILGANDNLLSLQEKVLDVAEEIAQSKEKIAEEKNQLANSKDDHEKLLEVKAKQKQELIADKVDTEEDIEKQDATIGQLQDKLNKLKGDLSNLLGQSISTDDIVEAAGIAAKATGVRKDFILGELVVETDLGRFTGGCTYKNTRMKAADKTAFQAIMKELGYDVNKKKISCSPGYGYGGAMGVAQFMPTTWLGYKSKIASATGHNPPDPWNIADGVVGMAIKLANAGATSKSGEKLASKKYYCGGPSSPYWKTKCETYAKNVQYWADNYEKKL